IRGFELRRALYNFLIFFLQYIFFLKNISPPIINNLVMIVVDSQDDRAAMNILNESSEQSPLQMDCGHALSCLENHIQMKRLAGIDLSAIKTQANDIFLDSMSEMMLIPALTECIAVYFYPLLPALVGRWTLLKRGRLE